MIQINNFSYTYGKSRHTVFNGLNLSFREGRIYGLLGANGVGKTTLLYNILGLLQAKRGTITMDGTAVRLRRPEVTAECFIIPEEFELPSYTLKKYVEIHAPFYPKFSVEDMRRNLALFGMEENPQMGRLSMGQKKKAYMCFALATNTSLLLMDEPTNGLDIPSKSQFRKVIASGMTDEKTIIISTHQVRDIDRLLDHITIIDGTEVLLDKSVKEITDRLYFCEQSMNEPTDGALFIQPSVQGNSIIMENKFGEESPMNLEVLFNAILAERNKIQEVFNK